MAVKLGGVGEEGAQQYGYPTGASAKGGTQSVWNNRSGRSPDRSVPFAVGLEVYASPCGAQGGSRLILYAALSWLWKSHFRAEDNRSNSDLLSLEKLIQGWVEYKYSDSNCPKTAHVTKAAMVQQLNTLSSFNVPRRRPAVSFLWNSLKKTIKDSTSNPSSVSNIQCLTR